MADESKDPSSKEIEVLFSTLLAECPELGEVVEQFVKSLPERVAAMQDSIRDRSYDKLVQQAHQLHGAGASYGYADISKRAAEIEQAAHDGVIDVVTEKIAEVNDLIAKIRKGLEEGVR